MENPKTKYEIHIFRHRHNQITALSRWDDKNQFAVRGKMKDRDILVNSVLNTLKALDKYGNEIMDENGNVDIERLNADGFDPYAYQVDFAVFEHPKIVALRAVNG